jgi:hypothetical protein
MKATKWFQISTKLYTHPFMKATKMISTFNKIVHTSLHESNKNEFNLQQNWTPSHTNYGSKNSIDGQVHKLSIYFNQGYLLAQIWSIMWIFITTSSAEEYVKIGLVEMSSRMALANNVRVCTCSFKGFLRRSHLGQITIKQINNDKWPKDCRSFYGHFDFSIQRNFWMKYFATCYNVYT